MPVRGPGRYQLRLLSARLREAGTEGQGLRRELYKAINEAAKPLAAEVKNETHLRPYMPDRYAGVLSRALSVTASKRGGTNPGVSIVAKGRSAKGYGRKVERIDDGTLTHPVFGHRDRWVSQRAGMRAGFFTDPVTAAAPDIRDQVGQAMHRTGKKITGG